MGGKTPRTPTVVNRDPIAEQRAAEAEAAMKANAELALRRRRRAGSSLLTAGAQGSSPGRSLMPEAMPNSLLAAASPRP